MSKYYIDLIDSEGNVIDTDDEVFDNEADAEDYADECNNAFAEGAEILEDDDDYMDPDEYEYVVREEWLATQKPPLGGFFLCSTSSTNP